MNVEPQPIEPWTLLRSEMALDERWCKVRQDTVRLPDGTELADYFVSVRPDVAVIVAVSASGLVPLVRQYKHGIQEVTLEFPAGTMAPDEGPLDAGRRELLEETGVEAELTPIGVFYDDASKNTNRVHCLVGVGAVVVAEQSLDGIEASAGVEVVWVSVSDIRTLLDTGEIRAQSSVAAGYRALSWIETEMPEL